MAMNRSAQYEKWWDNFELMNRLNPGTIIRKEYILSELRPIKFKKILDLGCGSGELLKWLDERLPQKRKYYGMDISRKALDYIKNLGFVRATKLVDFNKDNQRFTEKFDAVVCSEVIEHLDNWENIFSILKMVTKKKGKVIITTQSGKIFPHHKVLGHLKHFEVIEIKKMMEKYGFKVIKAFNEGWPFMDLKNYILTYSSRWNSFDVENISFMDKIFFKLFYYLYNWSSKRKGPQLIVVALKK